MCCMCEHMAHVVAYRGMVLVHGHHRAGQGSYARVLCAWVGQAGIPCQGAPMGRIWGCSTYWCCFPVNPGISRYVRKNAINAMVGSAVCYGRGIWVGNYHLLASGREGHWYDDYLTWPSSIYAVDGMYAVVMFRLFGVMVDYAAWCSGYGLGHERLCVQGRYRVDYVLYGTVQGSIAVFMVDMSTGRLFDVEYGGLWVWAGYWPWGAGIGVSMERRAQGDMGYLDTGRLGVWC